MPYQIKNGKVYGSNAVSLTQAQYDALSTAEKNNGTVYYIYDSDAVLDASEVSLGSGTVEDLAGSVAVIETSPATATHAVGSYLVYNGQLYKVTSAIRAGETLTPGTNISVVSVGGELTSLNSGYIYQQFDKAVAASTDTDIGTITLPTKGMWLVIGSADLNIALANVYNFLIYGRVVRGYGANGGGVTNALLINASSDNTAVDVKGYVPGTACNFRCTIQAIKLR